MQYRALHPSPDAGHPASEEMDACLTPSTLGELEPALRPLFAGHQAFVRQQDGRWRPKGAPLGLARSFETGQLQQACPLSSGRKQQS